MPKETLSEALRKWTRSEVRFDDGSRALYATDGSNYRQTPIGVVIPRDKEDILAAVRVCREHGVPLTSRGCGTSLAGQCCNTAVILDLSKYFNSVLEIDPEKKLGRVQPGCILDDLRAAASAYGLTFGPDPATHTHCTLGGMLGNDSCGVHSVMAAMAGNGARVADNTEELEVLTYDGLRMKVGPTPEGELDAIIQAGGRRGEIYRSLRALRDKYAALIRARFPRLPRRVSGYNLPQLLPENGFNIARALVGTEGTCVTILEASLNLIPLPKARSLLILGYEDVFSAGDHCPEILKYGPIGLEGMDDELIGYMKKRSLNLKDLPLLPEGRGWLIVEFGGDTKQDSDARARAVMAALKGHGGPSMKLFDDPVEESKVWEIRESGLGATAFVPGLRDSWPGWEDSAVPPEKLGNYLRELRKLFQKFGYDAALYGHFGQGCVHCRIPFDLATAQGLKIYRAFLDEATDLVARLGGSISGEHGDGQSRAELLPKMYGEEIVQAFREFKAIWDPENKMNPGKIVNPNPILSNLRLGENYAPWEPETHFHFPEDEGRFSRSVLRCVGVANCRRTEGGTMCPSFMVTREEKYSTRGRSRLLFEMLRGETIGRNGWRDPHVKEALDLCLACKGCKSDCPVNVDMATYKSEFLSHYYEGRLRPRAAYSMGLIYWWARLASHMPGVANFFTSSRPFGALLKGMGGIAPERQMPLFAKETFKAWFQKRSVRNAGKPQVLFWADTFNNYLRPEAARDAVEVLEAAGFQVLVPRETLCCGRPLYDWGMLDAAKRLLRQVLTVLKEPIRAGIPVVGLEPSCLAVFRDELTNLLWNDEDAHRLKGQTYHLTEFLNRQEMSGFHLPQLNGKALLHGHCQHKAVLKMEDEKQMLQRLGLELDSPETGCCGMAGSFGFEKDKYDISVKCGERALLPAVRRVGAETLVIADGFSCREQIEQLTGHPALHSAQVLRMALQKMRA
jgi:FAD/FMN-containing dehydrogenase/Fe-S oxidoreductase